MAIQLYKGNGAESNRSDFLELQATMTTSETVTAVNVRIDYYIRNTASGGMIEPGTRYGLLVQNFAVNDRGQIITRGSIIAAKQLEQLIDGSQSGSVTFSIAKGTSAKTYSGVTFLINDNSSSTTWSSDSSYMWTGQRGSSVSGTPDSYATTSFTVPVGYTACTAPTSISISKSVQKPGGNVTISWSGAKAGTNNPITGYFVYYRVGAAPTINTYDGYIDITSSSTTNTTFTIPNTATRGFMYYFKVRTKSGIGSSYYSTISSNSVTTKVNTLPNKPTVTLDKTIVPSGGGSVTFTLSAIDFDGQTTSFYYSTSAGGTKTKISSGGSISISNTTTYYFYSYDGLEYSSSYTSKVITKNIKPTISISSRGAGTLYTSDLLTNDSYKNFYTQVTGTATLSKTGSTITWYGRYATIPNSGSISSWTTVNLGVNNNTTVTHDLSSNSTFKTLSNIVYQIGAKCNDGIEDSNIAWGSTNFVIAPIPTISNFINQYGISNVSYSTANHFYKQASIVATKDSSVTSVAASITNNATVSTLSDTISNYKTNGYFKINITNTNINTVYTLTFTINRVIGSATKTFTITSAGLPYKSGGATLTSFDINSQTDILKPYSDNGSFRITLYNFFETLSYSSAKKNYNGTKLPTSCLSFDFVKGSKILNIIPTYSSDSSASSLYFTYNKDFYKTRLLNGENPLELDLENTNSIDLRITFKDVFGQSYTLTKTNYLTLDFREPFINEDGFSLTVLRKGIVTTDNIQEGDIVQLSLDWQAYNAQVATIETYIYRSSTTILDLTTVSWERFQNDSNYIWTIDTSGKTPTNLIRSGTSTNNYTITQLNKSNYVYFKIITNINGQTKTYYISDYRITQRHISIPSISFSTLSYEASSKLIKYTHSSYDSGGGDTPSNSNDTSGGIQQLEIGIQYSIDFDSTETDKFYISKDGSPSTDFVALITRSSEVDITSEQTATTEYSQLFTDTELTYCNIRLVVKTTINSITKTSIGEETTIYNLAPTVSYRKNQVGINVKPENEDRLDGLTTSENIKNTGALIVQATSGKDNIYIISVDNILKIKMTDGSIDGIIIDCGSWD